MSLVVLTGSFELFLWKRFQTGLLLKWESGVLPLNWWNHVDSCPYGTVYLSPPSDTSWRRSVVQ